MLELKNVAKVVEVAGEPLTILSNVNLMVEQGETVALVGRSGSGKSTALGIMAGLDQATSGDVILNETHLAGLDEEGLAELRANNVGFVFQSFHLIDSLSALENVMLPLELAGARDARQQALSWLDKVGLTNRIDHYPNTLSGGEQQRVAVARAFACRPKILFADEPTGSLDSSTGQQVADLLFTLNQEMGTTLILVTHDQDLAVRCNRQVVVDGGQLSERGRL